MKRLSFLELEKQMSLLSEQEMSKTLGENGGGDDPSWDCVLNCFDYLDDGAMNSCDSYYSGGVIIPGGSAHSGQGLPYNPEAAGGIRWQESDEVGANGGLNVVVLGNSVPLTAAGKTANGQTVMITIPGAGGSDHAVILTGADEDGRLTYYDPTTGHTNTISNTGPISGFYAVSPMTTFPTTTFPTTTFPTTTYTGL